MSQLELSNVTQIRLPLIKEGLLKKETRQQIATVCKVSRRTITRDIQSWIKTDDFLHWIREVWLDKYRKVDDVEAFRQATKILCRTLVQKVEEKVEVKERIELVELHVTEDEDSILNRAASILNRKLSDKKKLAEVHH